MTGEQMRHNTADPLTPDADGLRVATAVRAGEISAREAVEAAIARIEITDARFSFMVAERFEQALSEADRVDRSAPLAGVPMLTKDFLATVEGLTLTECSRFIPGWIPNRDCEYVARLKRAGAIILGSVTSSELAILSSCQTRRYGITRNPRALDRTTGGSSGGSGAAVAAGAVAVAHGSDAGGSIRMPAACCGVIGLKPTRGRNPLGPDYGDLGNGTWAEHVLTRSVRDSAALLDATSGPAPGDPYQAPPPHRSFLAATEAEPRRMRVAISPTLPNGMALHPDSAAALERAAVVLGELRHEVIEGNPKFDVSGADHDFFTLFSAGLAARVSMWSQRLGHEPSDTDLEPYTWHLLRRGRESTAEELVGAMTRLQYTSREIADFYESVDLWVTPTLGIPPFPLGYLEPGPDLDSEEVERRDSIFTAFTWPSNMTGQPALSFPLHETADGVPIGVQITGRFGDEDAVLGLAASLEAQMLRVQATPPMVGQ